MVVKRGRRVNKKYNFFGMLKNLSEGFSSVEKVTLVLVSGFFKLNLVNANGNEVCWIGMLEIARYFGLEEETWDDFCERLSC